QVVTRMHTVHTASTSRAALLIPLLWGVACQDVTSLQQSNPGQLSAATAYVPINAQLLVNGATEDFWCAYTRYVAGSGLFTDELSAPIANTATYAYDRRTLVPSATYGTGVCGSSQQPPIYTTLSIARGSADTVLARLREWTDAQMPAGVSRTRLIGQAASY